MIFRNFIRYFRCKFIRKRVNSNGIVRAGYGNKQGKGILGAGYGSNKSSSKMDF